MKDLQEVKEHFKYAKEVRCLSDGNIYDITKQNKRGVHEFNDYFWITIDSQNECNLYNTYKDELAEILTYIFDRGEEVDVTDFYLWNKVGNVWKFLTFDSAGNAVVERFDKNNTCFVARFKFIRKLTPESLLEPELTAFKNKAKEMNCTVTLIFEQK